eukprot:CAMPEP_0198217554 /NCGR_PEP_ID=MMETSP1445-20131203/64622_1 /TAXON_ID=36898 /ORGANISM="Pyramimonas sp., Strain CCMP2087" /LENGTH=371 /DNA_ID=CAMNT_0043894293 /DNA_START=240 /DNA_END=1351 /DNA_ORIENTATION=+
MVADEAAPQSWVELDLITIPEPLYTALSDYRNAYRGEPQAPSREQAPYVEESGSGAASDAADGAGKTKRSNNFLKGAVWSPDGSCLLSNCDNNVLHVYDLPSDCMESEPQPLDGFSSALDIKEGESVYDYCWYPQMSASEPATCCFATTSRALPIHIWDAVSGSLKGSYRAYDHLDEITTAYSLAFTPDGDKLFCGYNKMLRVFDVSRPGRQCKSVPTHQKKTKEGQSGILSCISHNPDRQGMMAVGSYHRTVGVYMASTLELMFVLHGHQGGVTQVRWSADGNYLYSGGRKDRHILCWDVRYTQSTVYTIERNTPTTNQKVTFDIEPCGRHLCTGGEDGYVSVHDLADGQCVSRFRAAPDCVNGFSFHPS